MEKGLVITIDGPAASGKSTVAKIVAKGLKFRYIDSGAMYRALAFAAHEQRIGPEEEDRLSALCQAELFEYPDKEGEFVVLYQGRDITQAVRTEEVGELASVYALRPGVRKFLTEFQRRLVQQGRVVVEGRDAGTVVFPEAELKFYLTAGPEVRAERRRRELSAASPPSAVKISRRDERDRSRALAPLTLPPDGIVIDSSALSVSQVVEKILEHIKKFEREARGAKAG